MRGRLPKSLRIDRRRSGRGLGAALAAGLAMMLATGAPDPGRAAAADAVAIAGGPDSTYQRVLGPRLRDSLFPKFEIELKAEENQAAALAAVVGDRAVMAFSQRDVFARFVRDTPAASKAVEFYGRVPACVYFVVRKSGVVERYADLVDPQLADGITLDVGPAAGETAGSFAALVEADPALGRIRLEHRGGVRALSRVASGQIDGAMLVAAPGVSDELVDLAVGNDALWVIAVAERDIFRDGRAPGFPFAFKRVPVGSGGWFGLGPEVQTICTEYGVVVNTAANPRLLEATATAVLGDGLAAPPASVMGMAGSAFRWLVDAASTVLTAALAALAWTVDAAADLGQALWEMRPWARGVAVGPDGGAPVRPARIVL